jgi:hypothetical protein
MGTSQITTLSRKILRCRISDLHQALELYEQIGPRGGRTGEEADSTRGKPLPPMSGVATQWSLVRPAHHKGSKR